jgi:soluble lytic murein transglycosylase-like protein
MKHKITIILLIAFVMNLISYFPGFGSDKNIEFYRLKVYYPKMSYQMYHYIKKSCKKYKVNINEACAIPGPESNWNPNALSKSGAVGLYQVMSFHYRGPKENLKKISINIDTGIKVYAYYLKLAKGNKSTAIRYYNAGPGTSEYKYTLKKVNRNYRNSILRNIKLSQWAA